MVQAAVERKDVARKKVLAASLEVAKDRCIEIYKGEKRKVKRCPCKSKIEVNEQFGRKVNQDVDRYRKLRRNEFSKANGG